METRNEQIKAAMREITERYVKDELSFEQAMGEMGATAYCVALDNTLREFMQMKQADCGQDDFGRHLTVTLVEAADLFVG